MYHFEELDNITRSYMLTELYNEWESGVSYVPSRMTILGEVALRSVLSDAIKNGNERTLFVSLINPIYWRKQEISRTGEIYPIRPSIEAKTYADTEFNYWYVRGLCRRLMDEGVEMCQVYRAQESEDPCQYCLGLEGKIFPVERIYQDNRIGYWSKPGEKSVICIPAHPNCRHSIRRVKQ